VGTPLRSAYSAAKHGLIGYHDSVPLKPHILFRPDPHTDHEPVHN
jgi:hypothetical protein